MPSRTRTIELKKTLQKNIISLCSDLGLGPCKENHHELRFGRKGSLSVSVASGSVGYWKSFETGEGGDIIDLISCNKNLDFVDTMRWVEDWVQLNGFGLFGGQDDV